MQWMTDPCSVQEDLDGTQGRNLKTALQQPIDRCADLLDQAGTDDPGRNALCQISFHAIRPSCRAVSTTLLARTCVARARCYSLGRDFRNSTKSLFSAFDSARCAQLS